MLVQFTSDAYENITMFGDVARQLLKTMGQSGTIPGALQADEVPAALSRLESGLKEKGNMNTSMSSNDDDDQDPPISLSHRAVPLIAMLKASAAQNCDVIWQQQ